MALVPWRSKEVWDPFRDLSQIQDEMNKLFDFSLGRWPEKLAAESLWTPAIEVKDNKDAFEVKAELPGMKKEDIQVSVHGDQLVIEGEKKEEKDTKEKGFVRSERYYGKVYRAVPLPAEINAEKVKASYKDGVLHLNLPKKEEARPKELKINIE
ncbi:MAG: Hsp20 family protein [Candidatus Omnitrophica bacterium]|nr:Hsp20 family protein [Candidatus Omnitrophota bacterium]